jgi:hypothetical protein
MPHESGALWRKKRGGREYGSFHTYAGHRIVNLRTTSLDEAREKARKLGAAVVAGVTTESPEASRENPTAAARFPRSARPPRPSYLRNWAGADGKPAAAPVAPTPPAAPPNPILTSAMQGLADGLATAVARLNSVAIGLTVQVFGGIKPAKASDDELEALEKTWATGIKELMLLHGLKWWHILLVQNGALTLRLAQDGEKIVPQTLKPVAPVAMP